MATKRTPKVTTTANFNGTEGADSSAPSSPMEVETVHADPANPPSGKLHDEVQPTEEALTANGMVKVVALMDFGCYGYGNGMYPLVKGTSTFVKQEHVEGMKSAGVIRDLREGDQ